MVGVSKCTADTDECVMLEGRFAHFRLVNAQDPLFPEDYLLRANSQDNPALQRYLEKDPALKQGDFYLFTPLDFYWPSSEYIYRQRPAEFTSNFVIHLEDIGNATTRVEAIEYLPTVRIGKRIGWSAHTGPFPQFFWDIRRVQPTTEDREELLSALEERIGRAIEANLWVRHLALKQYSGQFYEIRTIGFSSHLGLDLATAKEELKQAE